MRPKTMWILFAAVLTAGVAAGSALRIIFPGHPVWELLLSFNIGSSFGDAFRRFALFGTCWLILFAVLGVTLLAAPVAICLLFAYGVTVGASLGALYSAGFLMGFGKAVCFVMPYAGIMAILLFVAAREAVRSSMRLDGLVRGREVASEPFRMYCLRFTVLELAVLLLAVLHGFWIGVILPAAARLLTPE